MVCRWFGWRAWSLSRLRISVSIFTFSITARLPEGTVLDFGVGQCLAVEVIGGAEGSVPRQRASAALSFLK